MGEECKCGQCVCGLDEVDVTQFETYYKLGRNGKDIIQYNKHKENVRFKTPEEIRDLLNFNQLNYELLDLRNSRFFDEKNEWFEKFYECDDDFKRYKKKVQDNLRLCHEKHEDNKEVVKVLRHLGSELGYDVI